MFVRVTRWEGHTSEELEHMAEQLNSSSEAPPGVPASRALMLSDTESGNALMLVFFDSEEDLRTGDETLSSMSPPDDAQGKRTAKEIYRVAADVGVG